MFTRGKASRLQDLQTPLPQRRPEAVFFLRLDRYAPAAAETLRQLDARARRQGTVLEKGIPNPDAGQIEYCRSRLGDDFRLEAGFFAQSLEAWLPAMAQEKRLEAADALYRLLNEQRGLGKPDGALRNLYMKLMCWLYYRFRGIADKLGTQPLPLVLCVVREELSAHALLLLRLLNGLGADVLLLEMQGDRVYSALDPEDRWSQRLELPDAAAFPADFSLQALRSSAQAEPARPAPRPGTPPTPVVSGRPGQPREERAPQLTPGNGAAGKREEKVPRLTLGGSDAGKREERVPQLTLGNSAAGKREEKVPELSLGQRKNTWQPVQDRSPLSPAPVTPLQPRAGEPDPFQRFLAPARKVCPNAWMETPGLESALTPPVKRGSDPALMYTVLLKLTGVRNKVSYPNELYQFYTRLSATGRRILVVDGAFPAPDPDDLAKIRRRGGYRSAGEMIIDLAVNLPWASNQELARLAQYAFAVAVTEASRKDGDLRRLLTGAVTLLCWIRHWQNALFGGWRETDVACMIRTGHCANEWELLFLRWLSLMPVDLILIAPNLSQPETFQAEGMLELTGTDTLPEFVFPKDAATLQMRTLASHAREELDAMFSGTGLRGERYSHANALVLQTTWDEVGVYWDRELSLRPNYAAVDDTVTMPVIWAKMTGAPAGDLLPYWQKVKALTLVDGALLFPHLPLMPADMIRQTAGFASHYLSGGRIQVKALLDDRRYPYGQMRGSMQHHMLIKAQEMLDQRLINGLFDGSGVENTLLAVVLSLPPELQRIIHAFEFTGKNPKFVCVHTGEREGTVEDAILLTFLSLLGFDVLLVVPTGYQSIERYLTGRLPVEHQVGPYRFDVAMPDFATLPMPRNGFMAWVGNLLKRGNQP